jgi:hypothetical protein
MPVNPSRIAATPRKPVSADDDTNYPQNRAESREPDLCNCGAESLEILLPLVKTLRLRVEALENRPVARCNSISTFGAVRCERDDQHPNEHAAAYPNDVRLEWLS